MSSVICFENLFGMEFQGFFLSKNGSEWNSEVISLPKMVRNRIMRLLTSKNCLAQDSEGFSLSINGSEHNSEVFLFRETGGIPTELPPVLSCSVFRIVIFL